MNIKLFLFREPEKVIVIQGKPARVKGTYLSFLESQFLKSGFSILLTFSQNSLHRFSKNLRTVFIKLLHKERRVYLHPNLNLFIYSNVLGVGYEDLYLSTFPSK